MAVQKIKVAYIDAAGSSNGQVVSSNGTSVYWATPSSSGGFANGQSIEVTDLKITGAVSANNSNGVTGYVLTTTGSGVYWGTSGGGGSFDSSTSYTWTGVQTFNANVIVNATLTGSIVPRVNSNTTITTLNWTSANYEQYQITALAANLTISADSGTPVNGQKILFRIKDNGTSRTITWTVGSSKAFRAMGLTLPTATVVSKILYVGAVYNDTDARWDVIATALET